VEQHPDSIGYMPDVIEVLDVHGTQSRGVQQEQLSPRDHIHTKGVLKDIVDVDRFHKKYVLSITHHILRITISINPSPDIHIIPLEDRWYWQLIHHNGAQLYEGIG